MPPRRGVGGLTPPDGEGFAGARHPLPVVVAPAPAGPAVASAPGGAAARPAGTQIGCFRDQQPFDLDGYLEAGPRNTPQHCVAICAAKGFRYAGVRDGQSCLCGDSYGKYGPATNCNKRCTGGPMMCGGGSANLIFATGR